MARWFALLTALALAGCSGIGFRKASEMGHEKVEPNIFPADYKQKIITYLQNSLQEPFAIRDAALAPPVLKQLDTDYRYVACVRYNQQVGGQYLGIEEKAIIYFGGEFNQFIDATPQLCGGAAYQPFLELQALKALK